MWQTWVFGLIFWLPDRVSLLKGPPHPPCPHRPWIFIDDPKLFIDSAKISMNITGISQIQELFSRIS